jgi:hypothetical protein
MAWNATAMLAVAVPTSFLAATPGRRDGEEESSPEELRSFVVLEVDVELEVVGDGEVVDWGPMGITPVKTRFEAARARRVRARVRQR